MSRNLLTAILLCLLVIGLVSTLMTNPIAVLIPLVMLGIIFYFLRRPYRRTQRPSNIFRRTASYKRKTASQQNRRPASYANKYGPQTARQKNETMKRTTKQKTFTLKPKSNFSKQEGLRKKQKKQYPFRVIEGKKGKKDSNNSSDRHQLY